MRGASVVGASRQRVELTPGIAAELWNDSTVRAVQAADDLDAELADVRAAFATNDADIDETSALIHQKACVVLAASRKPMTEQSYLACLNAVASAPTTGRGSDPDLDRHLASAEALSDLAEARLRERGVSPRSDGFEDLFVAEVAAAAKQFGVDHYRTRRSA